MICTFFGHRFVPNEIEPALWSTLVNLIENHDVRLFYVGNSGGFDAMARRVLRELSSCYSINYNVVLAYMPGKKNEFGTGDYSDTIFPDGIETVPKRFAITYRNKWMIRQSDYVVTYVSNHISSGAAQFKELAEKWNKTVIELAKPNN